MLLPRPFALGLCAYLRQAGLSLDRAGPDYREAMVQYYEQHSIPFPARVLAELDRFSRGRGREVTGGFGGFMDVLLGRVVSIKLAELAKIRRSLHQFECFLNDEAQAANVDRIRVRLDLSYAASLLGRRLRLRPNGDAEHVEHLHASNVDRLRPLSQIAGASWPEAE